MIFWRGRSRVRRDGSRGFDGGDFALALFLLGDAQLFLHLHFEFVGGPAEFADPLSELAGELRQPLGAEKKQRQQEKKNAVREARHTEFMITG